MTTAELTPVTITRLTSRTVTVRLPNGAEQTVDGRRVLLVWCNKHHLQLAVGGRLRDMELNATLDEDGNLVVTGAATVA